MDEVFFIDSNGKVLEDEHIESHIGLAKKIVDESEELKKEFIENGYEKEDLFLVDYKGYILGSGTNYNKFIIVNKEKTTSSQKKTALTYIEEGYHPYFTDEEIVKHKF